MVPLNFAVLLGVFLRAYLENELVGLAQFDRVLVELLVLFDLLLVRSVEQQLLNVSGLQPVGGHIHQDLTQLGGGELQMGDEDGCGEREEKKLLIWVSDHPEACFSYTHN